MVQRTAILVSQVASLHGRMRELSESLDITIDRVTPDGFSGAILNGDIHLVIVDRRGVGDFDLARIDSVVADKGNIPLLLVVSPQDMSNMRISMAGPRDFIYIDASTSEYLARFKRLLWSGEENDESEIVTVENLTINLATYQVVLGDEPVDLTYMEYALFTFLATHPGRAYSRETLLHRVWGFDYCGGTRTVDVHVRRIRAKIGTRVASHIETVRGVGYLFKS